MQRWQFSAPRCKNPESPWTFYPQIDLDLAIKHQNFPGSKLNRCPKLSSPLDLISLVLSLVHLLNLTKFPGLQVHRRVGREIFGVLQWRVELSPGHQTPRLQTGNLEASTPRSDSPQGVPVSRSLSWPTCRPSAPRPSSSWRGSQGRLCNWSHRSGSVIEQIKTFIIPLQFGGERHR